MDADDELHVFTRLPGETNGEGTANRMKFTEITRRALKSRRDIRDMEKDGWERVGDNGGMLWELQRGYRCDKIITDVRISASGKFLWVKIGDRP